MSVYGTNRLSGGSGGGVPVYPNLAAFPATASNGALAIDGSTHILYEYNTTSIAWEPIASNDAYIKAEGGVTSIGPFGSTPNAAGGDITANVLTLEPADATHPGGLSTTTQTIAGAKTFSTSVATPSVLTPSVDVATATSLAIGTGNATTINIGNSGAIVNIQGSTIFENTTQMQVADPLITLNKNGSAGSASNSGVELEEGGVITGYVESSADRNSWILKAPNTAGVATITPGAGGITLDQSSHDPVTLGTANGLSLSTQVLSLALSSTSTTGALSSTDWNTFNGKQAAGSYITALTGDGTASGPGSAALTLATVNSNVGSFGSASASAAFTVNAKGLITAASSTSIQIAESQVTNLVSDLAGKQPTGNYITALTGDVTASGPGSVATTLATVNANVGSFGSSTSIPSFTVNGKGLITAASGNVVIAPAGTLTGTTLASNVVTSSLTSVGTITSGTWTGTTVAITNGGTGQTAKAAAFDALSPMTTGGDIIYGGASGTGTRLANGNSGQFLKSNGTTLAPSWANPTISLTAPTIQKFTSGSGTYTTPTSPAPLYIKVKMVGGGGGGGGGTGNGGGSGGSGGNGTSTTFGTTLLVAGFGTGGGSGGANGGAGGTASLGTGPIGTAIAGGRGQGSSQTPTANFNYNGGGMGASSPLGGAGGGGSLAAAGSDGVTNSGSGGGGGGTNQTVSAVSGTGGGAGGYVDALILSPSATYSYVVGTGGTAGGGGGNGGSGGIGGSGYIEVIEYYQ